MDHPIGKREISEAFNRFLDDNGFDDVTRKLKADTFTRGRILRNLKLCHTSPHFIGCSAIMGSCAEGTALGPDYDVDILLYSMVIEARNRDNHCQTPDVPYLVMADDETTPPGYTRLQLYMNGLPVHYSNKLLNEYSAEFHHLFCDGNGQTECFLSNSVALKRAGMETHGPAETEHNKMNAKAPVDYVHAYTCNSLPKDAVSWFQRKRPYGWPSSITCELLKKMGCFVVPVGHALSAGKELQWRISLSNQELHLMLNLNSTQYKCYILLKMIKSNVIKPYIGDVISSYHCKTALFYTIENSSPDIWTADNLSFCLHTCLVQLKKWVAVRSCPNYFLPKENMFETKLTEAHQVEALNKCLSKMIQDKFSLDWLFEMCSYGSICTHQIENTVFDMKLGLYNLTRDVSLLPCFADMETNIDHAVAYLKEFVERMEIVTVLLKANNSKLQNFQPFPERAFGLLFWFMYPSNLPITKPVGSFPGMLPTVQLVLSEEGAMAALFSNKTIIFEIFPRAKQHIHSKIASLFLAKFLHDRTENTWLEANHYCPDVEFAALYAKHQMKMATVYFNTGNFCLCGEVLEIFKTNPTLFLVICNCLNCGGRNHFSVNRRKSENLTKHLNTNIEKINKIVDHTAMCLIFDTFELNMVPIPLNYESYRSLASRQPGPGPNMHDCVQVDPQVYLHFLQYVNSDKLNKRAEMCASLGKIENYLLINVSKCMNILIHVDTSFNMLGHIYITKGWYRLAVHCFRRSLNIRNDQNAAKWHILFLMNASIGYEIKHSLVTFMLPREVRWDSMSAFSAHNAAGLKGVPLGHFDLRRLKKHQFEAMYP